MSHLRSLFVLIVPPALATIACSGGGNEAGSPCVAQFKGSDAGQPATITIDTSATVNTFTPKRLFGINAASWVSKNDMNLTQAKVQAAGNYTFRFPGGSSSDDYHWNGTGSYDAGSNWVPSPTIYTPGFLGIEMHRGSTSGGYQAWAMLTDGDAATSWLSNANTASPAAQWAYLDLGAAVPVDSLHIVWGTPYATSFQVQSWSGTSAWPPPYQAVGGTWQDTSAGVVAGTGVTQTVTFTSVTTQFIRVLLTASSAGVNGAYAIAELTAFDGATQLTHNVAGVSQTPTTVSSTDPANQSSSTPAFDFESFMTYLQSFSPAADAMITVNFGTGTPQEAAAWVHYANVVKQYGIRYWQVGNELEGYWETGGPLNAQDYVQRYVEYYDAMKAEDPSIVVLGPVSGGIDEPSNLGDGKTFLEDFIALLGAAGKADHIDGIDFHWYPNYQAVSDQAGLATVAQLGNLAANLKTWLAAVGANADVPVFLTEYNMGLGATNPPVYDNQLVSGLWLATALGEYASHFPDGSGTYLWLMLSGTNTPDATDATIGDLGYLQSSNNPYRYQERASYWAMRMMSTLWSIPGDTRPHQLVASSSSQASLATYAALLPDGALTLAVINRDPSNAYSTTINLAGFAPGNAADVWTFDASNYLWNTAATPYHAEPDTAPTHALLCGAGAATPFTFGPASITVIRFAAPGQPTAVVPDAGPATSPTDTTTVHDLVLVDDMETTESGPILLSMGNTGLTAGSWYVGISTGSTANTMAPDPFAFSALPASHETTAGVTSTRAAHLTCSIADLYGYCQQGFNFAEPEAPFDISGTSGMVFWAMSPAANAIKVQVPNDDTVPAGNRCGLTDAAADGCWNSFATYLSLTPEWQRYEIKWSDLHQDSGWGLVVPSFDPTTARGINFVVQGPASATADAVSADFWIDDVYFE